MGVLQPTPFLDIANKVNFAGERGLLGMAFDPSYATNGRFYVYYVDLNGAMTLERFGSTPGDDIAGASLGVVMAFPHGGSEHHGGMVAFGPDGMLYFGPGDGGCCGDPNDHAQDLNSLLGKILRIDVRGRSYSIPPGKSIRWACRLSAGDRGRPVSEPMALLVRRVGRLRCTSVTSGRTPARK